MRWISWSFAALLVISMFTVPRFLLVALVPMALLLIISPLVREKRARAFEKISALITERRFVNAIEQVTASRDIWSQWHDGAFLQGLAELMLWRIGAARASWKKAYPFDLLPNASRQLEVFFLSLVAAELEGDSSSLRTHKWLRQVSSDQLVVIEAIRAARLRDFERVRTLLSSGMPVARHFEPLCAALSSWARETPLSEVDRIVLLGETGVDQVATVWPEFAAFLRGDTSMRQPLPAVSHAK